jgi:hypothetical protein
MLAKRGDISIVIREGGEHGDPETILKWEVTYNTKYGPAGPLAFKVDTLVVNRRIEEVGRPLPGMICLGSLRDIAEQLGLGGDTSKVKKALYQNAFAAVTARITYRGKDGAEYTKEFGDTRYGVVFAGESLPDGRKADAVYIVLHDFYREILNHALTRPLNYDYLRELPPASQRFYELVSYPIFGALRHARPRAKLIYSEYCTYAPQIRYGDWEHVRKQMYKIHLPHLKSGYLAGVEFEATTDRAGRPDWLMYYAPGPRAKDEYQAFTRKGGLIWEPDPVSAPVEARAPTPPVKVKAKTPTARAKVETVRAETLALPPAPQASSAPPEPTALEKELTARGVTAAKAAALVRDYAAARITAQVEAFDWIRQERPKRVEANPAGYLIKAIEENYAIPEDFEDRAERARRAEAAQQRRQKEAAAQQRRALEKAREREAQVRLEAYWQALGPEEQRQLEAAALEAAEPSLREDYQRHQGRNPAMARMCLGLIRQAYLRRVLGLPAAPSGA